jgi:hypothetical protein
MGGGSSDRHLIYWRETAQAVPTRRLVKIGDRMGNWEVQKVKYWGMDNFRYKSQ